MNMSMIYDYLTKTLEALNENAIKEKYNTIKEVCKGNITLIKNTSMILTFITRDNDKTFKKNKKINTEEWLKCVFESYCWLSCVNLKATNNIRKLNTRNIY